MTDTTTPTRYRLADLESRNAALAAENARLRDMIGAMGERMHAMSLALSRVAERREMRGVTTNGRYRP